VVPDSALRIRYYHQDHLGSSSVMTDASGVLVEETAFYPFGIPRHEVRFRQIEESYKFTQKERDPESGLHYFEARYLTGVLSRFASADPKYADMAPAGDSQHLNLYAYARNNPLLYIDPSGLDDDAVTEIVKEVVPDFWIPGVDSLDTLDVDKSLEMADYAIQSGMAGVGRGLQIIGGAAQVAGGVTLCGTIVGCVIGGPLVGLGVDNVQSGVLGGDTILPGKVHIIAGIGGGVVGITRNLARKSAELGARNAGSGGGGGTPPPPRPVTPNVAGPKPVGLGASTAGSESDFISTGAKAAAKADAAAAAAYNIQVQTYTKIVDAQRTAMMGAYEAMGIVPSSKMVGDVMRNAIKQADTIWRATFKTRPPG
jgi:RHS repeat-associated protein